ncbi:MAG: aldehyde ferredoxin oxidoreductase [Planctomycetes bacterium]|nr:aldehyde ferredoxin oxidoreductase [Planctomycetota bacterium]
MAQKPLTGWMGRVLRIDLDKKTHSIHKPAPKIYRAWLGGRGLAGYYLQKKVTLAWDDPKMPLLMFTGPLTGTAAPSCGHLVIMTKSPLTDTIGDASVGGGLGTQLKRAGIDGIVITGSSDKLIGIEIVGEVITITSALSMKGMVTGPAYEKLKEKGSVAVIGPAAENGVLFANVMVDKYYAAGRGGLGAAFAAKNIKYITIKGEGEIPVCDPEGLQQAREDISRLVAASPVLSGEQGLAHYGSGAMYDLIHSRRMMPTDNFRKTYFEAAPMANAHHYQQRYQPHAAGCEGCEILCHRQMEAGTEGEAGFLPEYEAMAHFTALLGNFDLETVVKAGELCGELGMDPVSAAGSLACYSELSGERLSPPQILTLLEDMGNGRGLVKELGRGAYRYAFSQAKPEMSMSVKQLEIPPYDPRGAYGLALSYVTSTSGGDHLRAYALSHEILRKPVSTDRFSFSGKARIIKIAEDLHAVIDSLVACKWIFLAASLEEYAKAYSAVTGFETTAQDLMQAGERIYYHERLMNARNGFTAYDDDLPARFFEEAGSSSNNITIAPLSRDEFLAARAKYYQIRGLDGEGMPTEEKCLELGLKWKH